MITKRTGRSDAGFTLIEIMVVCAIIGIVMTMAIPSVYRQLHPESMQKAVNDILDACRDARAEAVLNDATAELVIRPLERQIEVTRASTPAPAPEMDALSSPSVSGGEWRMPEREAASSGAALATYKLSDKIFIQAIGLNGLDYTEDEVVRVRFYGNGTADQFNIVLGNDLGEQRMVFTEIATGMADIETKEQMQKYR
jgi:prepilin-type N-terminal cleavage/methylation domain-containing protein